jgi:hypothetical protein
MNRRREQVASLARCKESHDWQGCAEALFRALHGLPVELQRSLARAVASEYLPLFASKWPTIDWPAELLGDLNAWVARNGRGLPDGPDDSDPADSAFLFACDALLSAWCAEGDNLVLTSSCAAAVISAVSARQCAVWMADDPEGVAMWRAQGYFPGRSVLESRPAIAVAEREWEKVEAWLSAVGVESQPETTLPAEIERDLARWKDHEMLPIRPGPPAPEGSS